ncbi:methyltransferase type 11 [Grosmannia clavigera kw1407]|uniref:Methyltransferase type 11 n=1 Tax=Grosmannia clavigera (strain kw1407 / UAMH 11150) TaxID=655863 RepID=F0XSW0_GROCL|nr:methyltransferase type 11 [Grosmannia clavigera kw1407]EFW99140.1 methyltransferase type 11 [Grosmannia clavigera kw1407]
MHDKPKEIVEQTYDDIAEWYLDWVKGQDSPRERYTDMVLENAPPSPRILELGCGPGVPITQRLLKRGAQVVANDISARQLVMARARCPQATFVQGDMAALVFAPLSFDGIISFYTIFHLPRAEQRAMLCKISSWLRPGGLFACNLATFDAEEIHGEFLGHGMFWSSYGVGENKAMLEAAGMDLVAAEVLEAGDGHLAESDPDYGVKFLWVVARGSASA